MTMVAASLFSGIGAPEVAMPSWDWRWHAEIEKFPSAVMAARHPGSVNLGDVRAHDFAERAARIARPDILVFGSPCQSFSVAGKRLGLDDPRGNLALVALGIVARLEPRWFVFENVPGLLSSADGRDFGLFLRAVDDIGYSLCWSVLDAQNFGVAQRRNRVFAVGYLGDWRGPAAVLLEPEGVCGDSPTREQAREGVAPTIAARTKGGGGLGTDFDCDGGLIAHCLATASNKLDPTRETYIAHSLRADGFDASEDGTGRGTPLVAFHSNQSFDSGKNVELAPTLRIGSGGQGQPPAIAFSSKDHGADASDLAPTLRAMGHTGSHPNAGGQVAVAIGENCHANAPEADTVQMLRALRDAVDEETLSEWSLGILASFWPQEILRQDVHGRAFRCSTKPKRGLVNIALSRAETGGIWSVLDVWQAGGNGCPPQGWKLSQQLARQLGAYLSQLPYSPSPSERFLLAMWSASEGARLLRQALSEIQEIRRSSCGKGQPAHRSAAVRRLVVEECEALQGFPRSYTLIPYRGKPAADGPRYKALGNSMAVPVVRWILRRIEAVDRLSVPVAMKAAE